VTSLIAAAALAGLVGTPHCLAMCGGFAAASSASGGQLAWSLGRITTYAIGGAVVALVGVAVPGPGWVPGAIAGALLVWFVLGLAGLTPTVAAHPPAITRLAVAASRGRGIPKRFAFGMATALLPCGLVYAALAMALAAGSATGGAATMLAFGAATLPGLSLLSVWTQRFALTSMARRRAFAVLLLLLGGLSIGLRTTGLHAHSDATPAPAAAGAVQESDTGTRGH
jgi:uncharacterized protein